MQPLKKLTSPQYRQIYVTGIWLFLLSIVQTGCASYIHSDLLSRGLLAQDQFTSSQFSHRVFRKPASESHEGRRLHIYIEGDGQPWRTRNRVADDPTSPEPLMLEAMLRDANESIYLGRPCYYQVEDSRCNGMWWTFHRYHPDVVESIAESVSVLAAGYEEVWLIGHSGGGTLAVLAGRRLHRSVTVMTINPNLDHKSWTSHHDFTPLEGSLNPIEDESRNPKMRELHWIGEDDSTVLPEWSLAYCERFKVLCMRHAAGHSSGWLEEWSFLLRRSRELAAELP